MQRYKHYYKPHKKILNIISTPTDTTASQAIKHIRPGHGRRTSAQRFWLSKTILFVRSPYGPPCRQSRRPGTAFLQRKAIEGPYRGRRGAVPADMHKTIFCHVRKSSYFCILKNIQTVKDHITILSAIILLTGLISCQKDTPNEQGTSPEAQEVFSFTGEWYCPSIEWLSEINQQYTPISNIIGYPGLSTLYKTIRFVEGGSLVEHWQGCFVWNQMRCNPITGELLASDTVYYSVNEDRTNITLYVQTQDYIHTATMQVFSSTEMVIDGERYLRHMQNPTAMVSLPDQNWHYDYSINGFFFRGNPNRHEQLDLDNPIYVTRDNGLWVLYNMSKSQAVRPYANYNAMAEQPHGLFDCAGFDTSYEEKIVDYQGVTRIANVQNNGGQWCDTICEYAFAGCKDLTEVVLGMQVIKPYAFYGCSLRGIFLWFEPQDVASTAFDDWQYEHTTVHVSKYHPEILQTAPWSHFRHAYADLEHQ